MNAVKLVTFDVTNTMLRILGGVGHQYAGISKLYGVEMDPDTINTAFKKHWVLKNKEHPNFGAEQNIVSHHWWLDLVRRTFCDAGYQGDDHTLSTIFTHLYIHFGTSKGWEVLPGTEELLNNLKKSGIKLGVISNFDERLDKILFHTALEHYFDFIISSKVFKVAKPDQRIFLEGLRLGQCSAKDSIHIGDDVKNDYLGARNVGMTGILYSKDLEKVPQEVDKRFVISNLNDLSRFLV